MNRNQIPLTMCYNNIKLTDKTLHHNRPNIKIVNKTDKVTYIIDSYYNIIKFKKSWQKKHIY